MHRMFSVRITRAKKKSNLKATMVKMAGISNRISLTHGSVIEEIFKFRVDTLQEIFTFLPSVNSHRKPCMPKIIGSQCICYTGKQVAFYHFRLHLLKVIFEPTYRT